MLVTDIGRGSKAHTADEPGSEVRQDVAEHVLRDDHVELPWSTDQVQCTGIDVDALDISIWMVPGDLVKDLAKECHRDKHIGFVD